MVIICCANKKRTLSRRWRRRKTLTSMPKEIFLFLLNRYQINLRPLLPSVCCFEPSCSEYTKQAILKYGLFKGLLKGMKRLSLCHPFSGRFGYHPLK